MMLQYHSSPNAATLNVTLARGNDVILLRCFPLAAQAIIA